MPTAEQIDDAIPLAGVPSRALTNEVLKAIVGDLEALRAYALPLQSYSALRAYTGVAEGVRITSKGISGTFQHDVADTTTADNGGTVIVDASGRRWKRAYSGAVSPDWWGAVGNGITNDTAAIQAMFDAVPMAIEFGSRTYAFNKARVKNGTKHVLSSGATLKALAPSTGEGLIELDGPLFGGVGVVGCEVSGFEFDLNSVHRRGVFLSGASYCRIARNRIKNFGTTQDPQGIRLHLNCTDNDVVDNNIVLPVDSPMGTYPSAIGVYLVGTTASLYGGFENGAFVALTNVCERNLIAGNNVQNGTHGISLTGACRNTVLSNICRSQTHRSIILSPQAQENEVANNQCLEFGSSGIHMAYDASRNQVHGNNLKSSLGSEGGIQIYVGCRDNNVSGNRIECAANYGVYIAVEAQGNQVLSNYIVALANKKAAIGIENDWSGSLPAGALYSRPNYGAPPTPRAAWGIADTTGNVISGNTIHSSATIAAIYLAQIGAASKNTANIVKNNHVLGTSAVTFMFFEQTSGSLDKIQFIGNTSSEGDRNKVFMSRGRLHFSAVAGNTDTVNFIGFFEPTVKNVATQDVALCDNLSLAAYDAATNVTDFTGAMESQRLTIRLSSSATIVHDLAKIRLKGNVNVTANSNSYLTLQRISGIWFEVARSF